MQLQETTPQARPEFKLPKPKKKRGWLVALILLVAVTIGVLFLIQQANRATVQLQNALLTPVEATYRDLTVTVSGSATARSAEAHTVTVLIQGEVLEAPFEEGETVEKDALLYRIDPGDAESAIRRSELSLERARNSYNDLLKNISDTTEDIAEARRDLTLTAEDGGVVQKLHVKVGDTVMAGTQVAEILDRDNLLLEIPFHSAAARTFSIGQSAVVTVSGTGDTLRGTITELAYTDAAGPGGSVTRAVTIQVQNPGGLAEGDAATAVVGEAASASAGSFRYRNRSVVAAEKSGEIQALHVSEGGTVADGGAIYTLDGDKAAEALQNQLEAYQRSLRDTALSLEDAEIALQTARDQLDNYTILSPISGTVIEKSYKAGDNVEGISSGSLAIIYDLSYLTFNLSIDELDIGKIKVGQAVEITADALAGQTFYGLVDKININGVTAGGITSYPVRVVIDDAGELLPGMNVTAEILVEQVTGALTIPVSAVESGNIVRVAPPGAVDANGNLDSTQLVEVQVTLGRGDEEYIEVLSGLSEGDIVVINNQGSTLMDMLINSGGMGGGMAMRGIGG